MSSLFENPKLTTCESFGHVWRLAKEKESGRVYMRCAREGCEATHEVTDRDLRELNQGIEERIAKPFNTEVEA